MMPAVLIRALRFALALLFAFGIGSARAETVAKGVSAYEAGKHAEALQILTPLANQGDPEAQRVIGEMYYTGKGVRKDAATGYNWIKRAADAGEKIAQYNLGYIAENGGIEALPKDAAIAWYTKSAMQGYVPAQVRLGDLYAAGNNRSLAFQWYERAGFAGNQYAEQQAKRIGAELSNERDAAVVKEMREKREQVAREEQEERAFRQAEARQAALDARMQRNAAQNPPVPYPAPSPFDGLNTINRITDSTLRQIDRRTQSAPAASTHREGGGAATSRSAAGNASPVTSAAQGATAASGASRTVSAPASPPVAATSGNAQGRNSGGGAPDLSALKNEFQMHAMQCLGTYYVTGNLPVRQGISCYDLNFTAACPNGQSQTGFATNLRAGKSSTCSNMEYVYQLYPTPSCPVSQVKVTVTDVQPGCK
jgi:hypothetical protein